MMTKADRSIDVLNYLLAIEYRSLPMYLVDARPWYHPSDEKALAALRHIVTDQKAYVDRIAELVIARNGSVNLGGYPMEFTDTHDLSLDFLLSRLLEYQQRDVAAIEGLLEQTPPADRQARELVQEVLGSERAHLDALLELVPQAA